MPLLTKTCLPALIAAAVAITTLTGCATSPFFDVGRTEAVLPVSRAWVDGRQVDYVTTDISDEGMAAMMGTNFVPRLAAAARAPAGQSLLERVYKFPAGEQISVFQSAPLPVGAGNRDRAYSPLWRLVNVRWKQPARELRSEEAVLAAEERGELTLEVTDIVVNCPVIRETAGPALRGVR